MKPETTIDRSTQRSLTRKLLLLIAAFVIPLSVLSIYFLLTGLNKDVKFAEHELRGNTYQRKLEPLLRMLPEQRLLAGKGAGGDAAAAARLPQSEAAVERAFTDLAATDAKLGGLLLMTVEGLKAANMPDVTVATVRAKWEAARKGPAEEADKNLGAIIADVRQMIVHVGNKSNLILDPDLDSYYLMDVTLVALPQNQDRLGALAAFFSTLPALPAPEQSRELAARMALLREADLDRIAADVATALAEDKAFYGENAKMQSSYAAAMAEYRAAIEKVLTLASAEQIASAELVAATEAARTESFRFWDTSVDHLDALLQSRLDAFQATLIRSLAIALLGIAAAALAAFFIIRNLARSFGRMLDEQAAARTTAEQEKLRLQEQIQSLLMVVSDGSDGKLGVRAKVTEGALGNVADALNLMFENVGDLISSAQAASDKVAMAARQISATTLDLTAGSETQSAEVAQTASGVQALNAQAETVVRNCVAATEAVANARSAAENGALAVRSA